MNAKKAIAKLIEGKPLSPAQKKAATSKADALFNKKKGKEFPGGKKQVTGVGTGRINPKWSKAWDRGLIEGDGGDNSNYATFDGASWEKKSVRNLRSGDVVMPLEGGYHRTLTTHAMRTRKPGYFIAQTDTEPVNTHGENQMWVKMPEPKAVDPFAQANDYVRNPFVMNQLKQKGMIESDPKMKKDGSYGKVTMPGRKRATVIRDPSMPKWRFDKEKKEKKQ